MERAFRLSLRVGFVLLVLGGLALILYAVVSDDPQRRARPVGEQGPAAAFERPSARPEETEPAAGSQAGREPPSDDMRAEWVGFTHVLRDPEENREEAVVEGERAVLRDKVYDIFGPVVTVWPTEGGHGQMEVKGERGELDEANGLLRLFENVVVRGEDFEIRADRVVYRVRERMLVSDEPVRIRKDKVDSDGNRTPALVVSGKGLTVEVALKNITILEDVEAHLYDVSDDFLAAALEEATDEGTSREVVITCDGEMVYQHLARKVDFFDNVRAVCGEKILSGDQVTVLLGETEGKDKLEVSEIVAIGDAQLTYGDQVVRGGKLNWNNVTQTGVLTGDPCVLTTPQFEMTGPELRFHRINDRFHVEGPGTLLWKAPPKEETAPQPAPERPARSIGPSLLTPDAPVEVTWATSMTYPVALHVATFEGQVTARQQKGSLTCRQLALTFEPDTNQIRKVEAEGDVVVRDQSPGGGPDVRCDRLVWDAVHDTVDLLAGPGESVNLTVGQHAITSVHVILDNLHESLECPAPGRLTVAPSAGAAASAGEEEPLRTDIEWHEQMSFVQRPVPVATFTGQATARRGEQSISGESLEVTFDLEMEPVRIVAIGNAVMEARSEHGEPAPAQTGAGVESGEPEKEAAPPALLPATTGHWRLASDEIIVSPPLELVTSPTGGVLTMLEGDATTGIISWSKSVELDLAENEARFSGKVIADLRGASLKSETLRLESDEAGKLRHMWAEDEVHFARKGERAWELRSGSAEAVFGAGSQLQQIIARDSVEVRDGTCTLVAQLLQLFLVQVEGAEGPVVQRGIAQGEVRVEYEGTERLSAGGDRLEWNRDTDSYVLTGEPDAYVGRGGMTARNDKILLDRTTGKVTFPPGPKPVKWTVAPKAK